MNTVRANDMINKTDCTKYPVYRTGDIVTLKLTGEKLLIFNKLIHDCDDPDENEVGVKYFTRTASHAKKVVFACEIQRASENNRATFKL
jgi:hypothetical protein